MTSKVLVKLPTVPFSQGKKSTPELMTLPTKNEGPAANAAAAAAAAPQVRAAHQTVGGNGDRTAQLEQNMKFLQEQHQATLISLHQEVETLRHRNRDLQFQLVFTKSTNCVQSSTPSSPEDNSNGFVKTKGSPLCVNVTPLQVELLEKDLDEIKASFNEVKKHNQYLLEVIDKQNKKLQQSEKRKEKSEMADVGVQVGETSEAIEGSSDLAARLEDAETLVKRLRRENEDQQREIATMKQQAASTNGGSRNGSGRSRVNGHQKRGSQGYMMRQGPHFERFPALQTQSYWHGGGGGGSRGNHSFEHNTEYHRQNGRRRQDKAQQDRDAGGLDGTTVLPQLRNSNGKPADSSSYPPFYRSRGGYHDEPSNPGDYYRERGNRKYRSSQASQRDPADLQETRRDFKENKQDQQQQQQQHHSQRDATTNNGTQPSGRKQQQQQQQ